MSRYIGPVKWLGGIAVVLFVLAALFNSVAPSIVSESTRSSVLFQATPFFMAFVAVLLIFALLIVVVALRFNGKVPGRTHRGIEYVMIGGILFGTICLFNPWSFVPYRYGFMLLLIATLGFILWSHVMPPRADFEADVPPLTRPQIAAGLAAGLVVLVVLTLAAISVNGPRSPYGLRERVWNSYTPERQAEVASAAIQQFNTVEMPFLVIFNLFPGTLAFLIVRELVGGAGKREVHLSEAVAATGGGD